VQAGAEGGQRGVALQGAWAGFGGSALGKLCVATRREEHWRLV